MTLIVGVSYIGVVPKAGVAGGWRRCWLAASLVAVVAGVLWLVFVVSSPFLCVWTVNAVYDQHRSKRKPSSGPRKKSAGIMGGIFSVGHHSICAFALVHLSVCSRCGIIPVAGQIQSSLSGFTAFSPRNDGWTHVRVIPSGTKLMVRMNLPVALGFGMATSLLAIPA